MGEVGIYEPNELEGDLRRSVAKFRLWLLDVMPPEVLKKHCRLHWDEAAMGYVKWLRFQTEEALEWVEQKQAKINELKKFVSDVLVAVPLEDFGRGKELLGLGPEDEPLRPTSADDAFREAMIRAQGFAHEALPHERAKLWIAMMDAIARKQGSEAAERIGRATLKTLERQNEALEIQNEAGVALKKLNKEADEAFAFAGATAAPLENPQDLRRGDIVRNLGNGNTFQVLRPGEYPIVIRYVELTNAPEWERVIEEEDS